MNTPYGFRVVGDLTGPRRLIDWHAAHVAHCNADPRAEPERESYLSLFVFSDDFRACLTATGSTRGYRGPCALPYLTFDIDRDGDLDGALADARGLAAGLLAAYRRLDDAHLLAHFSGSKGFHVAVPIPPGIDSTTDTPAVVKFLAMRWADHVRVRIDAGIYDASRCFRSPNSRHPKTGLHKRRLTYDELLGLSAARIVELAGEPLPFDLPATVPDNPELRDDWQQAAKGVALDRTAKATQFPVDAPARLPKRTLALIRGEWTPDFGDRHRLLFSAAASLAECGCPSGLARDLLTEPGLNAGLSLDDVQRQISCGLIHEKITPLCDPLTEQQEG